MTADTLVETTAGGTGHWAFQSTTTIAAAHTFSVYMKGAGRTWGLLRIRDSSGNDRYAWFNLATGVVGTVQANLTASISSAGGGWYRCSITVSAALAGSNPCVVGAANADNSFSYTGDGTSGIYLWGAQLELGSTATAYQKVVSSFDVTEAGKADCWYLGFDGSDDFLVTPTITPGTDKVQVFAGVRKLSDAARGTVAELTASAASNNGAWHLAAPNAASATLAFESKGTALTDAIASSGVAAPVTAVVTGIADIGADTNIIRINGTQADSDSGDQGTGNFTAAAVYVGRRGGTSQPANIRLYQLIGRFGPNLTAEQIAQTETWVNSKMGAY